MISGAKPNKFGRSGGCTLPPVIDGSLRSTAGLNPPPSLVLGAWPSCLCPIASHGGRRRRIGGRNASLTECACGGGGGRPSLLGAPGSGSYFASFFRRDVSRKEVCKRRRRRRKPLIFPLQKAGGSRMCVLDRDLELTSLVFEHLQNKEWAYDTKGLQTDVVGLELVFLKPDFRVSALHLSFGGGGQMRHRAMGKGGLYISRSPLHHCALARWAPPACTACLCGRKGGGRQGRLLICVRAVPPPPPFHRREGGKRRRRCVCVMPLHVQWRQAAQGA